MKNKKLMIIIVFVVDGCVRYASNRDRNIKLNKNYMYNKSDAKPTHSRST